MSDIGSRILRCDAGFVAVNKLPGEATEGAREGLACLPSLLAAELPGAGYPPPPPGDALPQPTAAHRLDVPVTGCALFARSGAALRLLNAAFAEGAVEKRYWAVVEPPRGDPPDPRFLESQDLEQARGVELAHWISFDPKANKSVARDKPGRGLKKAILRYSYVGRGRDYLFLEIELVTGRHHQIRAQLERIGLRVKGDLKYGARRSEKGGGIRLHARSLSFRDLSGGDSRVTVQADPPLQDGLWQAFQEEARARCPRPQNKSKIAVE